MTLRMALSDLFKVSIYPFQDLIGFAFAKFLDEPIIWELATLGVVATVHAMTQRYHISRSCSGATWARDWYPMIKSYCMKQAGGPAAYSAATVEVFKALTLAIISKSCWKVLFFGPPVTCPATRIVSNRLCEFPIIPHSFALSGTSESAFFDFLSRVIFVIAMFDFPHSFRIALSPSPLLLVVLVWVSLLPCAIFAARLQAVCAHRSLLKKLRCGRVCLSALRAALIATWGRLQITPVPLRAAFFAFTSIRLSLAVKFTNRFSFLALGTSFVDTIHVNLLYRLAVPWDVRSIARDDYFSALIIPQIKEAYT